MVASLIHTLFKKDGLRSEQGVNYRDSRVVVQFSDFETEASLDCLSSRPENESKGRQEKSLASASGVRRESKALDSIHVRRMRQEQAGVSLKGDVIIQRVD